MVPSPHRYWWHRRKCTPLWVKFSAACVVGCCLYVVPPWLPQPDTTHGPSRRLQELSLMDELDGHGCQEHSTMGLAGLPLWIVLTCYMFLGLAIVCDDFFVASLEAISDALDLSPDVAGATFMAAGSSAPELFTSLVSTFFATDGGPGPGTIVGSAVFNITVIVAASIIFAGADSLPLDWWPLARDCSFYSFSILCLIIAFKFATPEEISWWEGLLFVLFYLLYILLMKKNEYILDKITEKWPPQRPVAAAPDPEAPPAEDHSGSSRTSGGPSAGPTSTTPPPPDTRKPSECEVTRLTNPKLSSSSHGMFLHQRGKGPDITFRGAVHAVVASELLKKSAASSPTAKANQTVPINEPSGSGDSPATASVKKDADPEEGKKADDDEDDEDEEEPTGLQWPEGTLQRVVFVLCLPLLLAFKYTIPDCTTKRWKRHYLLTFSASVLWIGILSFFMVDFAGKLGACIRMSPAVLGVTILAAGTSVPDALSSVFVARQGQGGMAVSNAIGSNIFDIFLGLGFPWFLYGVISGKPLAVGAEGITTYTLMLFAVLLVFIGMIAGGGWKITRTMGWVLFACYAAFATFSCLQSYGVITVTV